MPQRLEALSLNEISLVDAPANSQLVDGERVPRATIAIWKRDSAPSFDEILKSASGVKFVVGFPKGQEVAKVQSVLFDSGWDEARAKTWLSENAFKSDRVDKSDGSFRFRQESPEQFVRFRVIESQKLSKNDEAWDDNDEICKAVDGKTQDGVTYPKSDFAFTPDDTPSSWKLRLTKEPGGKPDAGIVGAAVAALGKGFRGKKVQIPADALPGVKAKVRAAWKTANAGRDASELPDVLKSDQQGENEMTLAELEAKVSKQDGLLAGLISERDVSKAETALVLKMSKKERKLYASMDEAKRKEYMAGDEAKRGALMGAADEEKKEKKLVDSMDDATKSAFAKAGPKERTAMLEAADAKCKLAAKGKKKSGDDAADPDDDGDDDAADAGDSEDSPAVKAMVTKLAAAEDKIAKSQQELAAIAKRERLVSFTKRAEVDLSHTPGLPAEKGERLMKLADAFGGEDSADFKSMFDELRKADQAFAKSFTEIGKLGGSIPAASAFTAKVQEIQKRDNIDEGHATMKVFEESPELYMDYERQHRTSLHSA